MELDVKAFTISSSSAWVTFRTMFFEKVSFFDIFAIRSVLVMVLVCGFAVSNKFSEGFYGWFC